jgi:hypothetical protein
MPLGTVFGKDYDMTKFIIEDELVAEVAERGGAISWGTLPNGVRCTNAQEAGQ